MDAIKQLSKSTIFEYTIIGLIVFTAGLIAFEAFPQWMTPFISEKFDLIHNIILGAFIVEAAIKLIALSPRPWEYFKSGWNIFDFSLIVLSLLPIASQFAMLGRVLRLLRVLRLINALPELRIIVETLLKSIPSMFHIMILMSILFFIYAVLGFHLFHEHDPTHWRDLAYSLLTLFRIVTLEDWTDYAMCLFMLFLLTYKTSSISIPFEISKKNVNSISSNRPNRSTLCWNTFTNFSNNKWV